MDRDEIFRQKENQKKLKGKIDRIWESGGEFDFNRAYDHKKYHIVVSNALAYVSGNAITYDSLINLWVLGL